MERPVCCKGRQSKRKAYMVDNEVEINSIFYNEFLDEKPLEQKENVEEKQAGEIGKSDNTSAEKPSNKEEGKSIALNLFGIKKSLKRNRLENIKEEQDEIMEKVTDYSMLNRKSPVTDIFGSSFSFEPSQVSDFAVPGVAGKFCGRKNTRDWLLNQPQLPIDISSPLDALNNNSSEETDTESADGHCEVYKYSQNFLSSEKLQKQLDKQNSIARQLIDKYFRNDKGLSIKTDLANISEGLDVVKRNNGLQNFFKTGNTLENAFKSLCPSQKNRDRSCDRTEQVCIKSSDHYVMYTEESNENEEVPTEQPEKFMKHAKPFKYQENFWRSDSNEAICGVRSDIVCEPKKKKSKFEYESNLTIKQNSSKNLNYTVSNVHPCKSTTEKIEFLDIKNLQSNYSLNTILYKNDSRNLANNMSYEDLDSWSTWLPERCKNYKTVYGNMYLHPPKESIHQWQKIKKQRDLADITSRFLDSATQLRVSEDEYKAWLRHNNFIKYTDYSCSSITSVTTFRSVSQKCVNDVYFSTAGTAGETCLIQRERCPRREDKPEEIAYGNSSDCSNPSNKLLDVDFDHFYQLVIYEHLAFTKCIDFFCCQLGVQSPRRLTVKDRVFQVLFLTVCYYISLFVNIVMQENMDLWL